MTTETPNQKREIDRKAVRALAERHSAELQAAAKFGRNVYQLSLDQQDKLATFAKSLSPEESNEFYSMYAEELNACTEQSKHETEMAIIKMNAEVAQRNIEQVQSQMQWEQIGGAIMTVVIFLFLFFAFR